MVIKDSFLQWHARLRTFFIKALTRVDRLAALTFDWQLRRLKKVIAGELRLQAHAIAPVVLTMILDHVFGELRAKKWALLFVAQVRQVITALESNFDGSTLR